MKYYIVGRVASGKTILSGQLSELLSIPVYHLDDIVHGENYPQSKGSDEEIDKLVQEIVNQENFIIEDVLRDCFTPLLHQVDRVVLLDLSVTTLKFRILKRFLKQKRGLEKSSYQPSLQMLKQMFTWVKDSPKDKVKDLPHVIILKNQSEIRIFLKKVKENRNDQDDCRSGKSR